MEKTLKMDLLLHFTPQVDEVPQAYFERINEMYKPKIERVKDGETLLIHNIEKMNTIIYDLRSLELGGQIHPKEFNKAAEIYNEAIQSRETYTNKLAKRVERLQLTLDCGISHLTIMKVTFEAAIELKIPAPDIRLVLPNYLNTVTESLKILRLKKAKLNLTIDQLPTLQKGSVS